MMNALNQITPLRLHGDRPCDEAVRWLGSHPGWSLAEAWDHCYRADWMLWLLRAAGLGEQWDHDLRVLAVEWRERSYRRWLRLGGITDPDPHGEAAISTAWRYLRGQASAVDLRAAAYAAYAAAYAAYTAAYTAAYAAYTAAAAADATAYERAADSASAAYTAYERARQADRLRQVISGSDLVEVMEVNP